MAEELAQGEDFDAFEGWEDEREGEESDEEPMDFTASEGFEAEGSPEGSATCGSPASHGKVFFEEDVVLKGRRMHAKLSSPLRVKDPEDTKARGDMRHGAAAKNREALEDLRRRRCDEAAARTKQVTLPLNFCLFHFVDSTAHPLFLLG